MGFASLLSIIVYSSALPTGARMCPDTGMDEKVTRYFKRHIHSYLRTESARQPEDTSLLAEWLARYLSKTKSDGPVRILDIGGSNGSFLKKILDAAEYRIEACNLELVAEYEAHSCDKRILFVNGSIFDARLKSDSFDCVVCRYGLHHFVGRSFRETRDRQGYAAGEMVRVVKSGGILVFEEEIMPVAYLARAIYSLSRICSFFRIRMGELIRPGLIVCFLTDSELLNLIGEKGVRRTVVHRTCHSPRLPLPVRIAFFFHTVSFVTYVLRIEKESGRPSSSRD